MAASMWEVTRLVLGAPGDAAGIAEAHGFTTAQVADLLPLFLDNVTTAFDGPGDLPPPRPDAGGADAVAHWLGEWADRVASGVVDVVSYDSFGAPDFDLDSFDPVDLDFDAASHPTPGDSPVGTPPELAATFGHGGDPADGHDASADHLGDGGQPADESSPVDIDDPFDLGVVADDGFSASESGDLQDGFPDGHHDPGPDSDGTAEAGGHFH